MLPANRSRKLYRSVIALSVAFTGILTLASTLFTLAHTRHVFIVISDAHFTVLAGISLIYLATLLERGKQNARYVAIIIYTILTVRNFRHFAFDFTDADKYLTPTILNLALPLLTLLVLIIFGNQFKVKSEMRNASIALRRSVLMLVITFSYGVIGFQVLDIRDFHQDISPITAAHYTVDQFGLTTDSPVASSKRARLFVDSLAAISLASGFYVVTSFFAPIRFRLRHNPKDLDDMRELTTKYSTTSEDFFKLWPRDKDYFYNADRSAALAYHSVRGVALVVGDPMGPKQKIKPLIERFESYCRLNDWKPAFIHVQSRYLSIYEKLGYESQKIGEEAIVDTKLYVDTVASSKYFRHINNRFTKLNYSCEMLQPPHSQNVIRELKTISDEWLEAPGRKERGFVMGYFSEAYMQQCQIWVARDENSKIQAFINKVPAISQHEANYDFLRKARDTPGNINDYIMRSFICYLNEQGVAKLNMGLSPLSGLNAEDSGPVNSLLNLVYSKAGRFYSFQGLNKFKSKYEPEWHSRYVIYSSGVRGLTRVTNSLVKAMSR